VVLDPVTVTKIWLLVKPYKRFKAWRQRRKGKRMAIDLGTRTSTNAVVGGGFLGVVYVNLVEILPSQASCERRACQYRCGHKRSQREPRLDGSS
jgi:hypothetical protein